jgi:Uma2 family endonuclease
MPDVRGTYTVEMWERLPADGNRYELLQGTLLVTPSPAPRHQLLVMRLSLALASYVERHRLGAVWPGMDLFHGPHTVLEPDIAVGLGTQAVTLRTWRELDGPALAVEILSPGSAAYDRGRKRAVYLAHRCEYWIVDPAAHLIERWLPGADTPAIHRDTLEWRPDPALPPLTLDVPSLFAELT